MRVLFFAFMAIAIPAAGQQSAPNGKTVVLTGTTSKVRIAPPDEPIVVNGRVMQVADFLAVLSSLDSLEEQRLRSPEIRNRETGLPTGPVVQPNSKCSPEGQAHQAGSCSSIESKPQDPQTKRPPK
jgi:hypothetical protein